MSAVISRIIRATTLTAALIIVASSNTQTAVADSDTRTLSFRNTHTAEELTVTFKRNGRYDDAALKKLNWFMRDWRKEQQVEMDPQLFDLVWETNRAVGGTQPIEVICGYRSSETNAMLRARSNGVAENSNHTRGLALDFFIPGVPLEKIREVGLRMQRGGVGFYPSSGSPFVHLDTGSIRHWPRMTYDQLAKVFPDGRTVHLPSNGQPLPGYELAAADAERQGRAPSAITLAAARSVTPDGEAQSSASNQRGLIETLLGFNKDAPAPVTAPAQPTQVASAAPRPAVGAIPVPKHRPTREIEVATYVPTPTVRPTAANAIAVALAEPVVVASAGQAFAYAAPIAPAAVAPVIAAPAKPMGAAPKVISVPATAKPAAAPSRIAQTHAILGLGGDPWLRATMLAPSTSRFLTTMAMGKYETAQFAEFVKKPSTAVVMSFSALPSELSTDRFSGNAVVFVATATFGTRTAALR